MTASLLQHRRHHAFEAIRPFFCQVEATETIMWLIEVAPKLGKRGDRFSGHIKGVNGQATRGAAPSHIPAHPSRTFLRQRGAA